MGNSSTKMNAKKQRVERQRAPDVRLVQVWQLLGGAQAVSENDLKDVISKVLRRKLTYDAAESVLIEMASASSSSHDPAVPCRQPRAALSPPSAPTIRPDEAPQAEAPEAEECMFCMECPRSMIWEGCGHVLYCEACSRIAPPGCPLCGTTEPAVPLGGRPCLTYCRRAPCAPCVRAPSVEPGIV